MKDRIVEELDKIIFHDLPFEGLSFDFNEKTASFEFNEYDDFKKEYQPLTIKFNGVNKFQSDYPDDIAFEPTGCNSAEYERLTDSYEIRFIMELCNEFTLWDVKIAFQSLEIHRTLSPLAIEYKNTNFESRMDEREWLEKHHLPLV